MSTYNIELVLLIVACVAGYVGAETETWWLVNLALLLGAIDLGMVIAGPHG